VTWLTATQDILTRLQGNLQTRKRLDEGVSRRDEVLDRLTTLEQMLQELVDRDEQRHEHQMETLELLKTWLKRNL